MRITIEQTIDDKIYRSIVDEGGVTADEVLQECIQAMLGKGFQEVSIKDAILTKAEEYEEDLQDSSK